MNAPEKLVVTADPKWRRILEGTTLCTPQKSAAENARNEAWMIRRLQDDLDAEERMLRAAFARTGGICGIAIVSQPERWEDGLVPGTRVLRMSRRIRPHSRVPRGAVYEFPTEEAYEAWETDWTKQ